MYQNNKKIAIFIVGLFISFDGFSASLNESCFRSLQSQKFYDSTKQLFEINKGLFEKLINIRGLTVTDGNGSEIIGTHTLATYEALRHLQTIGSLLPNLRGDSEDNVTLFIFGKKGTYKRKDLIKIYEVQMNSLLRWSDSALKQIAIYLPEINNAELRKSILELRAMLEEINLSLKVCN